LSSPSAPQKRLAAKGKSFETQITTTLSSAAAILLKLRTDAAQTPVSMLGKIFKTTRLPLKSAMLISFKPAPTNLKSGAVVPTAGKLPFVFTSDPLNVTVAIFVLFFLNN
jgi:hypothetical protein